MLTVLSLQQARRDWPARVLAERLDVSERTVRRDVDRLRGLGYRIRAVKGPDGGYRLDAGSELPPLLFDDDQAVALAVALQNAAVAGSAFGEPALRALAAVRQVLPTHLRHRIDGLRFTAVPTGVPTDAVDADVLLAVSAAVRSGEVLRFDYRSPETAASDASPASRDLPPARRAEPHHLVARNGRWYLVAYDLDRGDWRTFRVDRLSPKTPTGPRFAPREVPGGDVARFVSARFRGGSSDAAGGWPCTGTVILHAAAAELRPHLAGEALVELDDGRCRVTLGSWSWVALAGRIAQFDADFEVVGPPELAQASAALAGRFSAVGERRPQDDAVH
jgi:predicted DNA-binding transcriptional regulator YafY